VCIIFPSLFLYKSFARTMSAKRRTTGGSAPQAASCDRDGEKDQEPAAKKMGLSPRRLPVGLPLEKILGISMGISMGKSMGAGISMGKSMGASVPGRATKPPPPPPTAKSSVPLQTMLRWYYGNVFPFAQLVKWLDGATPKSFGRREIAFTLPGDIFVRHKFFADAAAWKAAAKSMRPVKMDAGATYSHPRNLISERQPEERELVFDIDASDYDSVRTTGAGTVMTQKCWFFMAVAATVLDRRLRDDFGFRHLTWIFSGRRGVHCWVCDARARRLTDEARRGITDYLSIFRTFASAPEIAWPLHPAIDAALPMLRTHFVDTLITAEGQSLLTADEAHWDLVLRQVPTTFGFRACVRTKWRKCATPAGRWAVLKDMVRSVPAWKHVPDRIVLRFLWPRLDANVTTQRGHLLKLPFCAHPATGKVCVPFDVGRAFEFDVEAVPTVYDLARQVAAFDRAHAHDRARPALTKTTLLQTARTWHDQFMEPLIQSATRP
jgi:DNA primase small subunit